MSTAGRLFPLARRSAEIALATAVVLVVGMMIVPLPTWLLDVLIATNLAVSVLVLVVALFVRDALSFGAFPTILLLTTLYRLALNVSSTRLILLQADAGRVIRAFGDFVVQGDYVVGAIVFSVLTLIQYLVIARGSERVAEVGARFTLDAMPGKQLAIDADLRAGTIDAREASARRRALERESQLYGAMDGAMKFVKGDAIAGMAIIAINLAGGLAIGVAGHDMPVGAALRTYGLLTIGDGLVSQIPSIVISTAAGLVVTRVASQDEEGSLGRDIGAQIFGEPRALAVAAAFAGVLAIVPGLPALPFAILAGLLGTLAWRLVRARRSDAPLSRAEGREPRGVALELRVGESLAREIAADARFSDRLGELADALFDELGVRLPALRAERRTGLAADGWAIAVEGVVAAHGSGGSPERLVARLAEVSRRRAHALLGLQETQDELDRLSRRAPALVRAVVPDQMSLARLTTLLRGLLREDVSIAALREILEALAIDPLPEGDEALLEVVRARLASQLSEALRDEDGSIPIWTLDPILEEALRDARGAPDPSLAADLVAAVRASVGEEGRATLVTRPDVRRVLRRVLADELPEVRVVSDRELDPGAIVARLGVVGPG